MMKFSHTALADHLRELIYDQYRTLPRRIAEGKITAHEADRQIAMLEKIIKIIQDHASKHL